jgi:flagellar hook assembly protein FlgD
MSETGYNETAIDDIYPNPASTTATVSFSLFKKQSISLKIVDVNGRLVTTIANGEFEEGSYDMNWDVSAVEAGIYFIQFESENISETKKLIVVK